MRISDKELEEYLNLDDADVPVLDVLVDLQDARKALARYKKSLEGLTPGGSEFCDEPETCAIWIQHSRDGLQYALKEKIKKEGKAEKALAEIKSLINEFNRLDSTTTNIEFFIKITEVINGE